MRGSDYVLFVPNTNMIFEPHQLAPELNDNVHFAPGTKEYFEKYVRTKVVYNDGKMVYRDQLSAIDGTVEQILPSNRVLLCQERLGIGGTKELSRCVIQHNKEVTNSVGDRTHVLIGSPGRVDVTSADGTTYRLHIYSEQSIPPEITFEQYAECFEANRRQSTLLSITNVHVSTPRNATTQKSKRPEPGSLEYYEGSVKPRMVFKDGRMVRRDNSKTKYGIIEQMLSSNRVLVRCETPGDAGIKDYDRFIVQCISPVTNQIGEPLYINVGQSQSVEIALGNGTTLWMQSCMEENTPPITYEQYLECLKQNQIEATLPPITGIVEEVNDKQSQSDGISMPPGVGAATERRMSYAERLRKRRESEEARLQELSTPR